MVQIVPAKIKDTLQAPGDETPMYPISKPSPGHHIMNDVLVIDAAFRWSKSVQVVPKAEWSDALLVDELGISFHMFDFRDPGHGYACNGGDAIGDDQPRVDFLRYRAGDAEVQEIWGGVLQIVGRRKKLPCLFQRHGKTLFAIKHVDLHGQPIRKIKLKFRARMMGGTSPVAVQEVQVKRRKGQSFGPTAGLGS